MFDRKKRMLCWKQGIKLIFLEKVQTYLNRYREYVVTVVENGVALCEIVEGRKTDDYKNKKSHY